MLFFHIYLIFSRKSIFSDISPLNCHYNRLFYHYIGPHWPFQGPYRQPFQAHAVQTVVCHFIFFECAASLLLHLLDLVSELRKQCKTYEIWEKTWPLQGALRHSRENLVTRYLCIVVDMWKNEKWKTNYPSVTLTRNLTYYVII